LSGFDQTTDTQTLLTCWLDAGFHQLQPGLFLIAQIEFQGTATVTAQLDDEISCRSVYRSSRALIPVVCCAAL
jgi:hypothetical protein